MKTFEVKTEGGNYTVNIPTSIKEITPEYLETCTENIQLAPEYSLVAVVYRESLAVLINTYKKKQNPNISIIPVFVKRGETDSTFISSLVTGNKLIVAGSDLSMGYHINSNLNKLTIDNIVHLCAQDKELYSKSLFWKEPCYFIEFKVVPNVVIHGVVNDINENTPYINPYVIKNIEREA